MLSARSAFLTVIGFLTLLSPLSLLWAGGLVEVGSVQRAVLFDSQVRQHSQMLLEHSTSGAAAADQVRKLERVARGPALSASQRDAVFYEYVRRLRQEPPDSVPPAVMAWLQAYQPQAVTRHPESASYLVALFDVAAAASGLANQWQFQAAADALADTKPTALPALLDTYRPEPTDPWSNGIRWALPALPPKRLDWLAQALTESSPQPHLLAYVHLARQSAADLLAVLPALSGPQTSALLQAAIRQWPAQAQLALMQQTLEHADSGVAALAMAQMTDLVAGNDQAKLTWGEQLLGLLDDEVLGANAALQLARMPEVNWLEQGGANLELSERARQRLELMAELEPQVQTRQQGGLR